jgi:hypothetical protein
MRRFPSVFLAIIAIAAAVAIGVGAYSAGYSHGLDQSGNATQIVRYVGPGFGFFPFGFLLFPLLFFVIFGLAGRGRRRHWNEHGNNGRARFEERFDEWHRSRHEDQRGTGASV